MKKCVIALLAAMVLTACEKSNEENVVNGSDVENQTAVVSLTFSPYEMSAMNAPRRAATSISSVVNHLDVWLYESGTEAAAVHQTSADAGFGTVAITLDKTKTYTLYAVVYYIL